MISLILLKFNIGGKLTRFPSFFLVLNSLESTIHLDLLLAINPIALLVPHVIFAESEKMNIPTVKLGMVDGYVA